MITAGRVCYSEIISLSGNNFVTGEIFSYIIYYIYMYVLYCIYIYIYLNILTRCCNAKNKLKRAHGSALGWSDKVIKHCQGGVIKHFWAMFENGHYCTVCCRSFSKNHRGLKNEIFLEICNNLHITSKNKNQKEYFEFHLV